MTEQTTISSPAPGPPPWGTVAGPIPSDALALRASTQHASIPKAFFQQLRRSPGSRSQGAPGAGRLVNRRVHGSLETEDGGDGASAGTLDCVQSPATGVQGQSAGLVSPADVSSMDEPFSAPETVDAPSRELRVDAPHRHQASVQPDEAEFSRRVVARIIAGDRAAETELVNHCERGIRRVLRRPDLNEDDREELLHDTWETALKKIRGGKLYDHAVVGAFVCGIAKWKAQNRTRSIRNHPTTSDPAVMDELLSEGDEPDRALSRAQDAELVW